MAGCRAWSVNSPSSQSVRHGKNVGRHFWVPVTLKIRELKQQKKTEVSLVRAAKPSEEEPRAAKPHEQPLG